MPSLIPAADKPHHPSDSHAKQEHRPEGAELSLWFSPFKSNTQLVQIVSVHGGNMDARNDDDTPMSQPTFKLAPKREASESPILGEEPCSKRRRGKDEDEEAILSDEDSCSWHNSDMRDDDSPPDLFGDDMKGIAQHDKENASTPSDTPDVSAPYPLAAFRKTIPVPVPSSLYPGGSIALRDRSNTSTSSNTRGGSITIESVITTPPRPLMIAINRLLSRTLRARQPAVRTPLRREKSLPGAMPTQEDAPRMQHPTPPAISGYSALALVFSEFPTGPSPGLVPDVAPARVESPARDARAHQGRLMFPAAAIAREETAGALAGEGVGGSGRAASRLADELRRERASRILVEGQARRMLRALVKLRDRRGSNRTIKRAIKDALTMVRTAQVQSPHRNKAHPTSHCAPAAPSAPQH